MLSSAPSTPSANFVELTAEDVTQRTNLNRAGECTLADLAVDPRNRRTLVPFRELEDGLFRVRFERNRVTRLLAFAPDLADIANTG